MSQSEKLNFSKTNFKKTKETMDKILDQAKESVKILEALQKEGVAMAKAKAKSLMNNKELPADLLLDGLKKMGLATRSEVRELETKVEELAAELREQISKLAKKTAPKPMTGKNQKNESETSA